MKRAGRVTTLLALAGLLVLALAGPGLSVPAPTSPWPALPFRKGSIWRRTVPKGATYHDVSAALLGDPAIAPLHAKVDLVTRCTTDPSAPLVNVERSTGWRYPPRSQSTGQVLYQRHLAPDACIDVAWNPEGNALFVLLDPSTMRADLGIGGWRVPGGPLLNTASVGPTAHDLDVVHGDGLVGYGRASGLPALGGLIGPGELEHGIRHAVGVVMPAPVLSAAAPHFVWPARSADGTADLTYRGADPALAMGTLLAVPRTVDLTNFQWSTRQGRNLAIAAQRYGLYVVDVHLGGDYVQLAMDTQAARDDLGLTIEPVTGRMGVDTSRFDPVGFDHDVAQLFTLVAAVPQSR
ncbi:MAG: hypothetical protein U0W40_14415 [Acidimicrobiia bacterium]